MSPYKYMQFYLGDILEFIEYMNENKKNFPKVPYRHTKSRQYLPV